MDDWKAANPGRPEGEGGVAMIIRMNDSHKPLREFGFSFIKWQNNMRILDVGCGGGATLADMLLKTKDSEIHAIDYSTDCVAFTKENNRSEIGKRLFVIEGDVHNLPYENNSFDLITAVETIYFWKDLHKALSECARVLKKGGKLVIFCEVDGPERMDWEKVNFDLKIYTAAEQKEALEKSGFVKIESHSLDNGYLVVIGEA